MGSPPEIWPPSSAYKLQCPWKPGVGNDEAPAVAWGRAGESRVALAHLVERWPEEMRIPWVVEEAGEIQQPLAGVTQAPWDFTL